MTAAIPQAAIVKATAASTFFTTRNILLPIPGGSASGVSS